MTRTDTGAAAVLTGPDTDNADRGSGVLLVIAGRAGTGKTTLARAVARATAAAYLRVDAIEVALGRTRAEVGADGYAVAHALAASNLELGLHVVVDAVCPVPESRSAWRETAASSGARVVLVETELPDEAEHRRRVESRRADLAGHRLPTWADVASDGWVPWDEQRDGVRTVVDTTDAASALAATLALL